MNKDDLNHQYDSLADDFSSVIDHPTRHTSVEAFRSRLPDLSNKKVLDFGCGEGTDATYYLVQGAAEVFGMDASKELLEKGKTKYPTIDFQYSVFEKTPYNDREFDIVLSKYAIQSERDLEPIFKEVHRILKSGGEFMCMVTHPIRQFYEKKKEGKDYFEQEVVSSVCFDGTLTFQEPTHTLQEYFSPFMLEHFTLKEFHEQFDTAAEKIVDTYPGFMLLRWVKN